MAFNHFHKKQVVDDRGLESRKERCDLKKLISFFKNQTNYPER